MIPLIWAFGIGVGAFVLWDYIFNCSEAFKFMKPYNQFCPPEKHVHEPPRNVPGMVLLGPPSLGGGLGGALMPPGRVSNTYQQWRDLNPDASYKRWIDPW